MANPIFPNQRSITIHKQRSEAGEFTYINTLAAIEAMHDLSYSAYMLYSFFNLNANNFKCCPSPTYISEATALKRNTYYKAMDELEDKGYLVLQEGSSTRFDFYERPPKSGNETTKKQDDVYPKLVENTNNNIDNNETSARPLDALGSLQRANSAFYNF